ncbi:DUF2252 domain-containing protein [Arthrobacter sp. GMC3]|uniref:DUF2252 domain-containing protein n=1 Tax=Arthrobacter sp. GMC3 TaxID=2058894 RepID=UPI000CE51BB8|nr:DUF2252 domain-containing protein [Arthrobacter sp. GMC3]
MNAPEPTFGRFQARAELGRAARGPSPRGSHARWAAGADRQDPIDLFVEQDESRVPELVPIRHGRMMISPFTYFRGAAVVMAMDLAGTPDSGITVQLCGDAHLSNFGLFASPERSLVFDINDFDETLPGPWEWDLKRLAASFEVAGRHRGYSPTKRRKIVLAVVRGYREQMRATAKAPVMTAWYDRSDADQTAVWLRHEHEAKRAKKRLLERTESVIAKARTRDSMRAFSKLVDTSSGELRIKADPPLVVPLADLSPIDLEGEETTETMEALLHSYQATLPQQNHPIQEFEFVDMARKVVGVGSVGTRAWIILLRGRDNDDPLLLQAKQAQASVLERYLPASQYENCGERVVSGQRLMQSASDIFLGWQRVKAIDGESRDFYLRQLHDWKGSADIESMRASGAMLYGRLCGETLARAHARTGDRVAISSYLGASERIDHAIARFAEKYADQNELDYEAFRRAVADGRLDAVVEH